MEKPFKCKICPSRFRTVQQVHSHSLVHLPIDSPQRTQHLCSVCGKGFLRISDRNSHENIHLAPKHRPKYTCEVCNHGPLLSKTALKNHKRKHDSTKLEQRKVRCEYCEIYFSYKSHLLQHVQAKHVDVQHRQNKCHICSKQFLTLQTLKRHVSTHEPDRQKFACGKCSKMFTSKYYRNKHEKKHISC